MSWKKQGLVFSPPFDGSWRDNSALTPTPILLNSETIRVFASFRDVSGTGRIGYVDLDAENPTKIIKVSREPVLDIGANGMFDDNGIILGDVIRFRGQIYMYYIGFQIVKKAKFMAFTGLAISEDNGDSFRRFSETPIMDRSDEGTFIRAIHSVIHEENKFKIWYATGQDWQRIQDVPYPKYDISYLESNDGLTFEKKGQKCLTVNSLNQEYRIGRPRVYKDDDNYVMNFTYGTTDGKYLAGQAMSTDGVNWTRGDKTFGIQPSQFGWDSKHLCYPAILKLNNKKYMFYNGNNKGKDGFGLAISEGIKN